MIPPHYISETHGRAAGRVVFTFQRLVVSPYHIHQGALQGVQVKSVIGPTPVLKAETHNKTIYKVTS